jgi:hypothetical protein
MSESAKIKTVLKGKAAAKVAFQLGKSSHSEKKLARLKQAQAIKASLKLKTR